MHLLLGVNVLLAHGHMTWAVNREVIMQLLCDYNATGLYDRDIGQIGQIEDLDVLCNCTAN